MTNRSLQYISLLLLIQSSYLIAHQCYSCGVFLSAPSRACKGDADIVNCTDASQASGGCLFISGQFIDDTYYVMKECATQMEISSMHDGECIPIELESATGDKIMGTKCYCSSTDACNRVATSMRVPSSLLLIALILLTSMIALD